MTDLVVRRRDDAATVPPGAATTAGRPAANGSGALGAGLAGIGAEGASPASRRRLRRTERGVAVATSAAIVLWPLAVHDLPVDAIPDIGLAALLPPEAWAALAILSTGFVFAATTPVRRWWAPVQLVALVAAIHGTPALLYGTLRYSWAYKHVGVVEFITRTGTVDPETTGLTAAYHSWPGFFALNAMLVEAAGLDTALTFASWWPLAVNLVLIGLVGRLAMQLGLRDGGPAVACWLFLLTSWVGQDYFGPQALALVWYLATVAVVLHTLQMRRSVSRLAPVTDGSGLVRQVLAAVRGVARRLPGPAALRRTWSAGLVTPPAVYVLVLAIAASHQLTPIMAVLAVGLLVATGYAGTRALPVVVGTATLGWILLFAFAYVQGNLDAVDSVTAAETVIELSEVSDGTRLAALAARVLTLLLLCGGAAGVWRERRRGRWPGAAAVLAAAPVLLLAAGSYGGEIHFRIVLFAAPFLGVLAATALWQDRTPRVRRALLAVASAALIPLLLLAYWGNEQQNRFSPEEVAAVADLLAAAPNGSLLVEGSIAYPARLANQESFDTVTLSFEPPSSRREVLADPAGVLGEWLDSPDHTAGYVIITRGMVVEAARAGSFAPGGLEGIAADLAASPDFEILTDGPDAAVFRRVRTVEAP